MIRFTTRLWLAWQVLRGRMTSYTAMASFGYNDERVTIEFDRSQARRVAERLR